MDNVVKTGPGRMVLAALGCTLLAVAPARGAEVQGNAEEGRLAFNQYCFHCHGTDAVQGERARDLRRLARRYGPDRQATYLATLANGRPDKGMPRWTGTLSEQAIVDIWAFLESVQAP